ncbi:MAG TPA: hypothetical protein PLS70_18855, partial [Acidobacteriota bacterium]|nr:hypothetical protein [Acidobacteriota bacterium]
MSTPSRKQTKSKFKLNTWHLIVPVIVIFLLGLWVLFGSANRARSELRILQDPDTIPPVQAQSATVPKPMAAPRAVAPLIPAQSNSAPTGDTSISAAPISTPQPIVASLPIAPAAPISGPATVPASCMPSAPVPPTPPVTVTALSSTEQELVRHSMVYAVLPEDRQSNRNRGQLVYRGVPLRLSATISQPVIGTPGLVIQATLTQGIPGLSEAGALLTGRVVQTVKNRVLVEFFRLTTRDGTQYRMTGTALDTTDGFNGLVGSSSHSI